MVKFLSVNYLRSPLRYPGGKNRAVKNIIPYISTCLADRPAKTKRLCSPFLGGGSIELACTSLGIAVYGYDIFSPLVDFWQEILKNPIEIAEIAEQYLPLSKTAFYNIQKTYRNFKDKKKRAAVFFVLNRSSFSGTTLSGGMSPGHPRFTQSSIERIKKIKISNLYVNIMDFRESIALHQDDFLYLDPPYANGESLYGNRGDTHKDFDHVALSEILHKRGKWILSYNDCDVIRELYKDYQIIVLEWNYGMNNSKKSNEVLIMSQDVV